METQEYMFYKINVNVSPADLQGTVDMSSIVRDTQVKIITIENPLSKPVQFTKDHIVSDSDVVFFPMTNFTIPEKSEFGLEMHFRPLIVGQSQAKLTLKNPELGESQYQLNLKGLA